MKTRIYQVDAFTDKLFSGNPAAVCPLEAWLDDETMQNIATENNLAETAFFVYKDDRFHIRWFTPTIEMDLCGHATLASAYIIFSEQNYTSDCIRFFSERSGELTVYKNNELYTLNFPADEYTSISVPADVSRYFDIKPVAALQGKTDYLFVFENEAQIKTINVNFHELAKLPVRGVIITAKGEAVDFVSRFFAPQSGVDEDPATGSAHTTLIPYWAAVLGKREMQAVQLSHRKGYMACKHLGNRVEISGNAKLYMKGEILIP